MFMPNEQDAEFMKMALMQAHQARDAGEVPVGAVLVANQQVIASGHNQPIGHHDPSAHAEIVTLKAAGAALGNYRLPETTLYVTLEPCMMCCGVIMHARVSRLVYGASDAKTGCVHSVMKLFDNAQLNHHTMVEGGVLADECAQVLKDFFKDRRIKNQ
jgi:tRNA(adenine34) deaminase